MTERFTVECPREDFIDSIRKEISIDQNVTHMAEKEMKVARVHRIYNRVCPYWLFGRRYSWHQGESRAADAF